MVTYSVPIILLSVPVVPYSGLKVSYNVSIVPHSVPKVGCGLPIVLNIVTMIFYSYLQYAKKL